MKLLLVLFAVFAYAFAQDLTDEDLSIDSVDLDTRTAADVSGPQAVVNLLDVFRQYRSCRSKTYTGDCIPSMLMCGHTEWNAGAYIGSVCYYVLGTRPHQSGCALGCAFAFNAGWASASGSSGSGGGSMSGGSGSMGGGSGSGSGSGSMGAGAAGAIGASSNLRLLDWFCDCLCGFGAVE